MPYGICPLAPYFYLSKSPNATPNSKSEEAKKRPWSSTAAAAEVVIFSYGERMADQIDADDNNNFIYMGGR